VHLKISVHVIFKCKATEDKTIFFSALDFLFKVLNAVAVSKKKVNMERILVAFLLCTFETKRDPANIKLEDM